MVPLVSALAVAVLLLLMVALSARISLLRRRLKIGLGDGGDRTLIRAQRAHGNLVEHAPWVLLALALYELRVGTSPGTWAVAAVFVVARLAHAWGFSTKQWPIHRFGVALTYGVELALPGMLLTSILQS